MDTLHAIFDLVTGRRTEIRIGRVSPKIMDRLGAHEAVVLLSGYNFAKQIVKHGEIRPDAFLHAQNVIDDGFKVIDKLRPKSVVIVYPSDGSGKPVKLVIKRTRRGDRLYAVSFHRITPSKARKFIARAIEEEWEQV